MRNIVPTLIALAASLLFCISANAQSGYSVQLAAYSSPASPKFFAPLGVTPTEIKIDASTYLYVADGFPSYSEADKMRKDAASKGFPDAIALKTSSSRMPALKVKEYTGPRDGSFASSGKSETPGTTKPASSTPPPPPAKTTTPAPTTSTYTSTAQPYTSTTQPYSSSTQPTKPAATTTTTQPTKPGTTTTTQPYSTSTYGSQQTTPTTSTYGTGSYGSSTYGNSSYGSNNYGTTTRSEIPQQSPAKANYNQNFEIQGSVVKELVAKGSLESSKVKSADVPDAADLVFFDFDKAVLRPSGERELGRIISKMQASPDFTLEIRAHTDNVGTDQYNNELSERRAKSVQIYMLKKGISANRLSNIRSYGEMRPIAANTLPDGSDNPMGRQLNRRVELILKDFTGRVVEVVSIQ